MRSSLDMAELHESWSSRPNREGAAVVPTNNKVDGGSTCLTFV